uniref:PD-(D/E)XK nuclease superfamily protein n=1 Tax=Candidatus Kentrum sp. MB TaxID=2138164 RepID=A0A450XE98_9GAMM|nr:MAG: PD-(D/E)XK nuclease superfamily protein [Candidatus Kentron sp. MB]VFK27623.1 MAG: PD-(D/E)XK nuclease superfamily protein [Candidatus Kentron sp. MB]VFK74363.1 MAG: PD-(D/E)XK nuclease superfamily protein [Candidatus Kentron sp. MB]
MNLPMNQKRRLSIGLSDFREFRTLGYYYVDKSLLVRSVLDASAQVLLLPRPRRFGKTLNLSMLRTFFERGRPDNKALFQGLAIEEAGARYTAHQGRYPVVFLTLKDVKSQNWEHCLGHLKDLISNIFGQYSGLLELDVLSAWEKDRYLTILEQRAPRHQYENSLNNLLTWLERAYGEQVVLLMDEYDTPIHAGYRYGYYDEVVGFLRNWLSGALKDHSSLKKGVLTGILRVAKESIFSGLNHLKVAGVLDVGPFADKFGFTEAEVEGLLEYYGLSESLPEVKAWYNGYGFGETVIYNPWSILNFIDDQPARAAPHWVNTSSNDLVRELLEAGGGEIREDLESLLSGGSVECVVMEDLPLRDIKGEPWAIWSLFLFSGYLKPVDMRMDGLEPRYRLAIPNREVAVLYRRIVQHWLSRHISLKYLNALLDALVAGNVPEFARHLQTLVLNMLSFHDTASGKKKAPEAVYQSFVLGLLATLGDRYTIRSNIESGLGRADILMLPKEPGGRGIVMEFKRITEAGDMETQLTEALAQIQEKQYATTLRDEGRDVEGSGAREGDNILALGIVFDGKRLEVRAG